MSTEQESAQWKPIRPLRWINAGLRGVEWFRPLVRFEETDVLAAARLKAGSSDFGTRRYEPPLRALLADYRADERLTPLGKTICHGGLVHHMANRARISAEFARRPELKREEIRRPLFVVGLPRTGTTLLFNLLAQDEAARPLLFWESMHPVPLPTEKNATGEDPRIRLAERAVKGLNRAAPNMKAIHEFQARGPEECLGLLSNALVTPFFRGNLPEYQRWLAGCSQEEIDAGYEEYRAQLQLLQAQRRGAYWLLKCPSHLLGLASLLKMFPDARIIQTHRNVEESVPSLCSLSATMWTVLHREVDPHLAGVATFRTLEQLVDRNLAAREDRTDNRVQDVHYQQFVADPVGTIERVFAGFDMELSPGLREKMQNYLKDRPQARHGAHRYTLEQFGLSREKLGQRFAAYNARFGIA